jgi:hypothetical protein
MTSKDRHEARYQRRKAARERRKREHNARYDDYNRVFDYDRLYEAGTKCCRGVRWKASVQRFETDQLLKCYRIYYELMTGCFRSGHFRYFDLYERGHLRHIRSLPIEERTAQRTLCDNALIPVLTRSFIYDNGACMKGKGIGFAEKRLTAHLERYFRKYGSEGYALVFDFSKYFDNADHEIIKAILRKMFTDERLIQITAQFVDDFGEVGLGLGSQISQVLSLALANRLDHEIKDAQGMTYYVRYMDDGVIFCNSKKRLRAVLAAIERVCDELHIRLNRKKTHIVRLSRGFTFLKLRYFLLDSGRIIRKPAHSGIKRERRRIKKLRKLYENGRITLQSVINSTHSWLAHCKRANTYLTRREMLKWFFAVFPEVPRETFDKKKRKKVQVCTTKSSLTAA